MKDLTIAEALAEAEGLVLDYLHPERLTRPHRQNLYLMSHILVLYLMAQQQWNKGQTIGSLADDAALFLMAAFEMGAQAAE